MTMISQGALKDGIKKVKGTIGKPTTPALTAIHIKGDKTNNTVTLTTQDLINSTRYVIETEQAHDFEMLIPAKLMDTFTSKMEAGEVRLDVRQDNNFGLMKYHGAKRPVELAGYKPSDFPVLNGFTPDAIIRVNSGDFKELVKTTGYAAQDDVPGTQDNVLAGVGLSAAGRWLYAQVTDMGQGGVRKIAIKTGHNWLADVQNVNDITVAYPTPAANDAVHVIQSDADYGWDGTTWQQLVFPSYEIVIAANNLVRLANNLPNDMELEIGFNSNRVQISCGPIVQTTGRMAIPYPPLRGKLNQIRAYACAAFVTSRDQMEGALERAMVIMSSAIDSSYQVWLDFDRDRATIRTPKIADANGILEEEVAGLLNGPKKFTALVNAQRLMKAISVIPSERVIIYMTEAPNVAPGYVGPSVVVSETTTPGEEPTASYLLLPLQPSEGDQLALRQKDMTLTAPVPVVQVPAHTEPEAPAAEEATVVA